jgi:ATP-dependent DNA helicase RecG
LIDERRSISKIRNHVIVRRFREAEALGLPQPEIIEVRMLVRFIIYLAKTIEIETTVPSRLKSSHG